MRISIQVRLEAEHGDASYSGGTMQFSQDGSLKAGSFSEIAEIMSAFHNLFEAMKTKFLRK